jgi:hypothetical protein
MAIRLIRFFARVRKKQTDSRVVKHPIRSLARPSHPAVQRTGSAIGDERERAGLLTSESFSGPAFPSPFGDSGVWGPSSSVTAAQPSGIRTRFPILL